MGIVYGYGGLAQISIFLCQKAARVCAHMYDEADGGTSISRARSVRSKFRQDLAIFSASPPKCTHVCLDEIGSVRYKVLRIWHCPPLLDPDKVLYGVQAFLDAGGGQEVFDGHRVSEEEGHQLERRERVSQITIPPQHVLPDDSFPPLTSPSSSYASFPRPTSAATPPIPDNIDVNV